MKNNSRTNEGASTGQVRAGSTASMANASGALAILRIIFGAMFVWVFFENLNKGLYTPEGYSGLVNDYIERGTAPASWKEIMSFMANNAVVMAPLQAVTEIAFGLLLVAGLLTRLAALAAFAFLTSLWISEWGTAWIWELLMPMAIAISLALGAAGRKWGLDSVLAGKYPGSKLW